MGVLFRNMPNVERIYANIFADKMWVAFTFFSKNTCELDIVLLRTVNILTTNELVMLKMLWTTGPRLQSVRESDLRFILSVCIYEPTKRKCTFRSCAEAQSDQALRCQQTESLDTIECFTGASKCPDEILRMCRKFALLEHARKRFFDWRGSDFNLMFHWRVWGPIRNRNDISHKHARARLTFKSLLANSAGDKLVTFYLLFPENRIWHFMQNVSDLTFHGNCLQWRQFACDVKTWKCQILFDKKEENKKTVLMSSAENFTSNAI